MQRVEKLEHAVKRFLPKCGRMLVVVIPGADQSPWDDHHHQISHEPPDILDQRIDREVDHADQENQSDREPVSRKFEYQNLNIVGCGPIKPVLPS